MKYYNNEIEVTEEEAHALADKSNLIVSDGELTFEKKGGKKKHGR